MRRPAHHSRPRLRAVLALAAALALASGPERAASQATTSSNNNPLDVAGGGAAELARAAARTAAFLSPNGVLGDATQTAEQAAEVVAAETTAVPQAAVDNDGGRRGGGVGPAAPVTGLAGPRPQRARAPPAPLDGGAGAGLPVPPGGRAAEAARAAAALIDRVTERGSRGGDVSPPADRRAAGAGGAGGAGKAAPPPGAAVPPSPPATRASRYRAADGSVPPADWDEKRAASLVADTPQEADAVTTRASPAAQGLAAALAEVAAAAGLPLPKPAAVAPPPSAPAAEGGAEPPTPSQAAAADGSRLADPLAGPSTSTIADRQQGARFALDGASSEAGKAAAKAAGPAPAAAPFTLADGQAAAGGGAASLAPRRGAPRLAVSPSSSAQAAATASATTPPTTGPFALLDAASGTKLGGGGGGAAVVVPPRAAPVKEGGGAEAAAAVAPPSDELAPPAAASLPDAPTRAAMTAAMVAAQKEDGRKEGEEEGKGGAGAEPALPSAAALSWRSARPASTGPPAGVLTHHGGPTLMDGGTVVVVPVFYGPAWTRSARAGVVAFLGGLGGTKWWAASTARLAPGGAAAPLLAAASPVWVTGPSDACWMVGEGGGPEGGARSLSPTGVASVAACVRERGRAAADPASALFLVLGDAGTAQDGGGGDADGGIGALCSDHCGWHAPAADAAGRRFALAFAGSPARCPAACAPQWPVSPGGNGTSEEGATLAALAHNLAALTVAAAADPLLDGWHGDGLEPGTACAWAFPPPAPPAPAPAATGEPALVTNAVVGGRAVLLPGVLREDGSCAAAA